MDAVIRPASLGDQAEVEALCASALDADLPEDAAAYPSVLTRRPHIQLVAAGGDGVVGVVIGSTREGAEGTAGYVDLLAVLPAARRAGVGRTLLTAMEGALREAGCGEAFLTGHPPFYAWPGVDVRYSAAICLAESAGYQRAGDALNMHADLAGLEDVLDTTADEARLAADGISVRRLLQEDEESIRPWLDGWGGSWAAETLATLENDPVRCHVALDGDDGWLGFAAWGVNRPGIFGPMGTNETMRGKGIGSVLLRRCLADQQAAGIDRVEIGWTGPYAFYARTVGARITRIFWQYRKSL